MIQALILTICLAASVATLVAVGDLVKGKKRAEMDANFYRRKYVRKGCWK